MNKQTFIKRTFEYNKDVDRATQKFKHAMRVTDNSADGVEVAKRYRAELEALYNHYYVKAKKIEA